MKLIITRQKKLPTNLPKAIPQVIYFPTTLTIPEPIDIPKNVSGYDAVLFTSANAVRYFFDKVSPLSVSVPCYAISEVTHAELVKRGVRAAVSANSENAETFFRWIDERNEATKRFLFVRGALSRDVLPQQIGRAGGECDELVVYRTEYAVPDNLNEVSELLRSASESKVVAFFSPSAVRGFVRVVSDFQNTVFCAIGSTTADSIKMHMRVEADLVATKPQEKTLLDEIVSRYF